MSTYRELNDDDVVVVTGATGFTGRYVMEKLRSHGCRIRIIARPSSNLGGIDGDGVTVFRGDVYDEAVMNDAICGANYAFHLAAAYREAGIDDRQYELVHVTSTKLLAQAALRQPDFRRLVHVSTVGVLGHIENPPADENSEFHPGDIYQETKAEAETWVRQFAAENSLPITVVRPAAIYGPGDRRLLKLYKLATLPAVPLIGRTRGLYHLIHVEDLSRFLIHAATHAPSLGQVYICGSEKPVSIRKIVEIIATHLGRKPRFLRIPAAPVFVLGDIVEAICGAINVEPPIYRRRIAFFTKDRSFDTTKMRTTGEFECSIEDEDGLRRLADWYIAQGWLKA